MMQVAPAPRPAVQTRPAQRSAASQTQKPRQARREVSVPAKKGGSKTAMIILVAGGIGAVAAYFLLRVL
jgi:hypothetical protein